MQEALLSLLLLQHLVVAMWQVHSQGLEREAVLALRKDGKRGARAWGCSGQRGRAGTQPAPVLPCASGHKEPSCTWKKHFHHLLDPQPSLKAPGRQGANTTSPNYLPSHHGLGFGGQHGNREKELHSLWHQKHCQQQPPCAGAQLDLPPRASGVSTALGEGGTAQGMAEKAVWP